MARRNPPAKWPLPSVVDPATRRCIQVQVPDDPAHIAAFRGAMLALQSAYNWADDPAHTARLVAQVWRDIIDGLTTWGCNALPQTILQADPSGCGIQWSLDDGVTWETIDLSSCITALAENSFDSLFGPAFTNALEQAIADGTVQAPGGERSPVPAPAPGECSSVHVVLQARENWLCSIPVGPGSHITVENASGGWNDGTVQWYCSDGNSYGWGSCTPDTAHYELTDPYASAHHMIPVGRLLTSGLWFDPNGGGYDVPLTEPEQLFVLQANDQSLSDNYGEIQFDVQVCTGGWTYTVDFRGGMDGWIMGQNTYRDSQGVHSAIWNGYVWLNLYKALVQPGRFRRVNITGTWAPGNYGGDDALRVMYSGASLYLTRRDGNIASPFDLTWEVDQVIPDNITVQGVPSWNGGTTGQCTIETVTFAGNYPNPFVA